MRSTWFVLLTLCACGGSSSEPGPPEEGPPILDRSPRIGHQCAITHEAAIVSQSQPQAPISLARTGAGYFAARGANDPETYLPEIALSELRFDPVELAPPLVEMPGAGYLARPVLLARDGALGLSWVDDSETLAGQELRFAVVDEEGEIAAGPVTIHGADDEVMIRTQAQAAGADGFALLWADDETVYLALLDDGGAPRGEPERLAGPGDEETYLADPFVVAVDDQLVAAWTESYRSADYNDPEGGHAVVRIARVSGDGDLLGTAERLQASEDGIVSALSSLLPMDGAIAVAWTRETYIAVCGGCVSDATVRLVLLDPVDLVPVSETVELVGPSGIRSAPMVGDEDGDLAFFMTVDYHALADLAGAMIRCTPAI